MKNSRSLFKRTRRLRQKVRHPRRPPHNSQRFGIVAVEAALCMLAVIPIMFGTLEICAWYYLKESLTIAAYEGARYGARDGSTPAGIRQYCKEILNDRGVNVTDGEITIEPSSFANRRVLSPIRVTIKCPTAGNSIFVFDNLANRDISASIAFASEAGLPPLDLNN